MNIFAQWQSAKDWIVSRLSERSTWDGGVIIGISVLALLVSPFVKWAAAAGIAYGVWTIWKKEQQI